MGKRLSVKYQGKILPELSCEIPEFGILTVGNDSTATLEIKDNYFAPEQFVIICEPDQTILMCRVDGTIINNSKTSQGAIHNLQDGDFIVVGDYVFLFEDENNQNQPDDELISQTEQPAEEFSENKNDKTLNDVLKSLRSEEKFYFQVETSSGEIKKLFIENEESILAQTQEGELILTGAENVSAIPLIQIRKDWSGIVANPIAKTKIWIANKPLVTPHRLKNDDQIYPFSINEIKPDLETFIRFHEPTTLLVLDTILPKDLPPPISLNEMENAPDDLIEEEVEIHLSQPTAKLQSEAKRLIFGYFTIFEIIIMCIGTLITAALIFLILEFY